MKSTKSLLAALVLTGAVFGGAVSTAFAANEVNTTPGYTSDGTPLALHGYDPVAFFTVGKPTVGNAKFVASHNGASYYFSSQENLDKFKAEPAKYEPQYGGYCAYGVSVGKKFDGNPDFWKIINGKLYLNLNADVQKKFDADTDGSLKKAEGLWPKIQSKAPGDL